MVLMLKSMNASDQIRTFVFPSQLASNIPSGLLAQNIYIFHVFGHLRMRDPHKLIGVTNQCGQCCWGDVQEVLKVHI